MTLKLGKKMNKIAKEGYRFYDVKYEWFTKKRKKSVYTAVLLSAHFPVLYSALIGKVSCIQFHWDSLDIESSSDKFI